MQRTGHSGVGRTMARWGAATLLAASLNVLAALDWIGRTGLSAIASREREVGAMLLEGLLKVDGVSLQGRKSMEGRVPVFSVNFEHADNGVLADILSRKGFETRPGLHCAPLAHKTLGTFPQGSLRVSPGYFSTAEDVALFLDALTETLTELRAE